MPKARSTRDAGSGRDGLARLVQQLAPGGRLVRSRRLRGGVGARMDVLDIERANGTREKVSLRRFARTNRASHPEHVAHEYRILRFLETTDISAPCPLLLDANGELFGVPAIALEYLPGAPVYLPRDVDSWTEQLAEALLGIHAVTPRTHDLSWLHVQLRDGIRQTIEDDEPRVQKHSALAREVHAALARSIDGIEWLEPAFVHDDYWPGNTVWYRGRLTGVIDWTHAEVGDPRSDVAQCRLDLALINGVEVSDGFVRVYQSLAVRPLPQLWYFDLLRGLHALLSYEFWFAGYQDARLKHMTRRRIRTGIEAFLRRALEARRRDAPTTLSF
jgi:aminoglycoside phosphotransferase (APT) family kinase protein